MRVSKDQENQYIQVVRRLLVAKPNMTVVELQRQLERNGMKFVWRYVDKLRRKARERNRQKVKTIVKEAVVGEYLSMMEELQTTTWTIIMDQGISPATRISAIRTAMQLGEKALNVLFDTEILERHLGTLTVQNEEGKITPLPAGMAEGFLKSWKVGHFSTKRKKRKRKRYLNRKSAQAEGPVVVRKAEHDDDLGR